MNPIYIVALCVVAAAIIILGIVMALKNKKAFNILHSEKHENMPAKVNADISTAESSDSIVEFEDLPALTEEEDSRLVEIKDEKVIARINGAVPGTLQILANAGALRHFNSVVKSTGQLYQAIIPNGAVLSKSRDMAGAVRGIYHGAKGISGHANLVPVNGNIGSGLAAMNITNNVMSAAAIVVGQYYMTQINKRMDAISGDVNRIACFQDNEFRSKVYALVAEIQKCSSFRLETIESEELRERELVHLDSLRHECIQLLGQVNLSLKGFAAKTGLSYDDYEKCVEEADIWYQYQQILSEMLGKICELTYALNLGTVSKENCYALYQPYAKQSEEALAGLNEWHKENVSRLQIDLNSTRRKRSGIDRFAMAIPALFKDDYHYKAISDRTADMISSQTDKVAVKKPNDDRDLFREDVRLIIKDGSLYYLPPA